MENKILLKANHAFCFLVVAVFLLVSCGKQQLAERETTQSVVEVPTGEPFRNGDMVLRCGRGMESQVVTFGEGSVYSHIGMLYYDSVQNGWMVIHAVPQEAPEGEPEYIKYEPIEEFYTQERATVGAWMRIECPDSAAQRASEYCLKKYNERVVFDNFYLLQDTTELYCCELVWRAYLQQGIDITSGNRHYVPIVFSSEEGCIFPNDIENGMKTEFVKPFKIKTL